MTDTSPERMAAIQKAYDGSRIPAPLMWMVRDLIAKVAELEAANTAAMEMETEVRERNAKLQAEVDQLNHWIGSKM